jgi:hypothetical protein
VVDPSILGIAKGVDMVLQRLKRVEQGIRDFEGGNCEFEVL